MEHLSLQYRQVCHQINYELGLHKNNIMVNFEL